MDGECGWVGGGYGRADVSRADADWLRDECKERKKKKHSPMDVYGNRERADVLGCGCIACGCDPCG